MKHYLVIQLARFGDLLQTKRLILSLQGEGEGVVHLLVDGSLADLARFVYPGVVVHSIMAHRAGDTTFKRVLASVHGFFEVMKGVFFHRVYNLNYSGLNFSLAAAFPPEITKGYRVEQGQIRRDEWSSILFRLASGRRTRGINLVDFWAGYCEHRIHPKAVNPKAVPGGRGIGVVLAGRNQRRSLPVKVLAPIVHAALQRLGHGPVYLFGSPAEQGLARDLMREFPSAVRGETVNLAGRTGLLELANEVNGLDLLLTPDTGTMHLAAHLGVPVRAFFLSSAWCFETGPYGSGHEVYQATCACAPCLGSSRCRADIRCLSPFSAKPVIRHLLTGTSKEEQDGMTYFTSLLDDLGCTYQNLWGRDPGREDRQAMREHLCRHPGSAEGFQEKAYRAAEQIILERDWMLDNAAGRKNASPSTREMLAVPAQPNRDEPND
ncbi:MAG: glycosyltransferase family 9 protein [Desulfovibrionales bacterium]